MQFGFGVPTRGPLATPDNLAALARRGEALGFEIVTVPDHVVIPRRIQSRYPYTETGEFAGAASGESLEQLTVVAFLAAGTSTIRLLTSVMVLPYRHPVLAAKILATIDVLSGGRLIVGVGAGWLREEFQLLDAPPYDHRGTVSREYISAFKQLWTADEPELELSFTGFSNVQFYPKPVQKPHPPIWVGGESTPALRRAGELGDGWYPIGNNPSYPMDTPGLLAAGMNRVRRYREQSDRDSFAIDFAYSASWYNDRAAQLRPDGSRRIFTGVPEQVAGDIRRFANLGVGHLIFNFQGNGMSETLERMERFATEVRPLAGT